MKVYAIDIETGGLAPGVNSLLEICIKSVDIRESGVTVVNEFYSLIKPKTFVIDASVMELHLQNGLLKQCLEEGEPEELVKSSYKTWAFNAMHGKRGVAVGFNVKFDTNWLRVWSGKDFFTHRTIDPRQKWCRLDDEGIPSTDECFKRAGLIRDVAVAHRAKADCNDAIELFRCMF